jgi:hypothetical protein
MPVSSLHRNYKYFQKKWLRCRNVVEGSDAVKAGRELYLPILEDQSLDEYERMLLRANFYPATSRTKDGMHGFIFRKQPTSTIPEELLEVTSDMSLDGTSLYDFSKNVVDEVLTVGRYGTLIDWSDEENRPVCINYACEDIINWDVIRAKGKMTLSLLVLRERVYTSTTTPIDPTKPTADDRRKGGKIAKNTGPVTSIQDIYEKTAITQYRVFHLRDDGQGNSYVETEIWQNHGQGNSASDVRIDSVIPVRRGETLDCIPFVFHGPKDINVECSKPPLLDIVDVNLSHYRSSSDLEHAAHFTALPTLITTGFPKGAKIRIGSAVSINSDDPNAKAYFLEYMGAGITPNMQMCDRKEAQMAAIGARMLEAPKAAAEAATTLEMRSSGEKSVLAQIADSCSNSIIKCLYWCAWWSGIGDGPENLEGITYQLNTDFISNRLGWQDLTALVAAWQQKALSKRTLFNNLKKGEIVDDNTTFETEEAEINEGVLELPDGTSVGDLPPTAPQTTIKPTIKLRKKGKATTTTRNVGATPPGDQSVQSEPGTGTTALFPPSSTSLPPIAGVA